MRYQCLGCGSTLEYNLETGKMECRFCGTIYEIGELDIKAEAQASAPDEVPIMSEDLMACKIFSCTSCGAEIVVNGVESAKFCAYCGQSTIAFDRISGELRPSYIIPFQIKQEQAMQKIQERIENSYVNPEELKGYSMQNLRGIYIPYRLYDIEYYDDQIWRYESSSSYLTKRISYAREVKHTFKDLAVSTSSQLGDLIAKRLEPYNMSAKKPFEAEYLSGFYADRYDMSAEETNLAARGMAKELFDRAVSHTVDNKSAKLVYTKPQLEVLKSDYVLMPAWFMTLECEGKTYTFVVNGQTGKVVGMIPIKRSKVVKTFAMWALIINLISVLVFYTTANELGDIKMWNNILMNVFTWIALFATLPYVAAYFSYVSVKKIYDKTTSQVMKRFVRER